MWSAVPVSIKSRLVPTGSCSLPAANRELRFASLPGCFLLLPTLLDGTRRDTWEVEV